MRKSDITEPGIKRYALSVLIGSLAGFTISLLLLLPMSAFILAGILDEGISGFLLIAIVFAGSLVGGVIAAKRVRARSIVIGLITGVGMFLCLCIAGLLLYNHFVPTENGLSLILSSSAGGILGGKISAGGRSSDHSRRIKRK